MLDSVSFNFENQLSVNRMKDDDSNQTTYSELYDSSPMKEINLKIFPFDKKQEDNTNSFFEINSGNVKLSFQPYNNGTIYREAYSDSPYAISCIDFDGDGLIDLINEEELVGNVTYNKSSILSDDDKTDFYAALNNNQPYAPRTDQLILSVRDAGSIKGYQDLNNDGLLDIYNEIQQYPDGHTLSETKITYNNTIPTAKSCSTYDVNGDLATLYSERNVDYERSSTKDIIYYDADKSTMTIITNQYEADGFLTRSSSTTSINNTIIESSSVQRQNGNIFKCSKSFYQNNQIAEIQRDFVIGDENDELHI